MSKLEATELSIAKLIVKKSKRAVVAVHTIDEEIKKRRGDIEILNQQIEILRRMRGPLSSVSEGEGFRFSGAKSHDPDDQLEALRSLIASADKMRFLPANSAKKDGI